MYVNTCIFSEDKVAIHRQQSTVTFKIDGSRFLNTPLYTLNEIIIQLIEFYFLN